MSASADEKQLLTQLGGIDIPACPAILEELDTELRKEVVDQRIIARVISRDVALAGQLMQVANSPAFFTGREVGSISQAITVLGMRQVFNLLVTQLLKVALNDQSGISMDRFWETSALTARVASELARRLRCVKPDMAYTFSLFHHCGMPLLMKRFPDYQEVLDEAHGSADEAFTAIEESWLGTHHAVVGYFLARRWKLPEFVAQGILTHHDYDGLAREGTVPPESLVVVALNALAEHIVTAVASQGEEKEWEKAAAAVTAYLGLEPGEVSELVEDVVEWLEQQESQAA